MKDKDNIKLLLAVAFSGFLWSVFSNLLQLPTSILLYKSQIDALIACKCFGVAMLVKRLTSKFPYRFSIAMTYGLGCGMLLAINSCFLRGKRILLI